MKILLKREICFMLASIFLLLITSANAFSQTDKEIVKIRAEVAAINKGAAKYTKTTKNVEGISLEGTEATYYFAGEDLRKVTAEIYGESFNATGEFYYRGGELIFAYVKHRKYDQPARPNRTPKVTRTEEQRFYFGGGELIRLLIGKRELKSADERYSELREEIIGISKTLKES